MLMSEKQRLQRGGKWQTRVKSRELSENGRKQKDRDTKRMARRRVGEGKRREERKRRQKERKREM